MKRARCIPGAALAGLLVVAAAACNSITGLDDYDKVECVGACGEAGPSDAGNTDVTVDAPLDVSDEPLSDADEPDGGPEADVHVETGSDVVTDVVVDAMEGGVVDPRTRWARWPMPHEVLPPVPDGGSELYGPTAADLEDMGSHYQDNVTGRSWLMTEAGGPVTWGVAVGQCNARSSGGAEYRLPTRIELITLLEPSLSPPRSLALDDTELGYYWTASEFVEPKVSGPSKHWVVDFEGGAVESLPDNEPEAYVRCILDS